MFLPAVWPPSAMWLPYYRIRPAPFRLFPPTGRREIKKTSRGGSLTLYVPMILTRIRGSVIHNSSTRHLSHTFSTTYTCTRSQRVFIGICTYRKFPLESSLKKFHIHPPHILSLLYSYHLRKHKVSEP